MATRHDTGRARSLGGWPPGKRLTGRVETRAGRGERHVRDAEGTETQSSCAGDGNRATVRGRVRPHRLRRADPGKG